MSYASPMSFRYSSYVCPIRFLQFPYDCSRNTFAQLTLPCLVRQDRPKACMNPHGLRNSSQNALHTSELYKKTSQNMHSL